MRAVSCCVTSLGTPSYLYVSCSSSRSGDLCVYKSYRCAYLNRKVGVLSLEGESTSLARLPQPRAPRCAPSTNARHVRRYLVPSMSPGCTAACVDLLGSQLQCGSPVAYSRPLHSAMICCQTNRISRRPPVSTAKPRQAFRAVVRHTGFAMLVGCLISRRSTYLNKGCSATRIGDAFKTPLKYGLPWAAVRSLLCLSHKTHQGQLHQHNVQYAD